MAPSAALSEEEATQSDLSDADDSSSFFLGPPAGTDRLKSRREMLSLSARSALEPRREPLSNGGIAGVVVGVILFLALALICAYPFVVRRISKGKLHGSTNRLDPEPFIHPQGQAPAPGPGLATRQSSKDSSVHKTDTVRGTERQCGRDVTWPPHDGISNSQTDDLDGHQQHGTVSDGSTQTPSVTTRRGTDNSFGRATTWKSDSSYPWAPVGVELVATRADGMEYSETAHGHSASYYSPTIPSEAFGMVTPPSEDALSRMPAPRRSSSRGSSLKLNLFGLLSRRSTKDSVPTRTKGHLTQPPQPVVRQTLSDSPTELNDPSLRELSPGAGKLASPFPFPVSPISEPAEFTPAQYSEAKRATLKESPAILPPTTPAPGTVNPMDIMAPSNATEQTWRTNQQLYQIANPPAKPADTTSKPPPEAQPSQAPTPESPEHPFEHHQQYLHQQQHQEQQHQQNQQAQQAQQAQQQQAQQQWHQAPTNAILTSYENGQLQMNHWNPSSVSNIDCQDVRVSMNGAPQPVDKTHLMPDRPTQHYHYEGEMTDRSDHSPHLAGHASSGASYQTTPNTLVDSSPSPRSDGSSDIRNSTSPYTGMHQSPRSFMCDECGRFFDQVHKLNHHKRYHDRPHECEHPGCGKKFGTKTHLDRHINDKHKKTKKFHCTVSTCPYSKAGGKSFPRKDNWRRHMVNIHQATPMDEPEPDLVDESMGGT